MRAPSGFELAFNRQREFLGHAQARMVDGLEPAGNALRLALRPDLAGLAQLPAQGIDKVQASAGSNSLAAADRQLTRLRHVADAYW